MKQTGQKSTAVRVRSRGSSVKKQERRTVKERPSRPKEPGIPPESLTPEQRKMLRGLGHALHPLVLIGKDGITDGVVHSLREALIDHELVKARLLQSCSLDKDDAANEISERSGAILVQRVGKTFLLYAPHPTEPTIQLPRTAGRRPKAEVRDTTGRTD